MKIIQVDKKTFEAYVKAGLWIPQSNIVFYKNNAGVVTASCKMKSKNTPNQVCKIIITDYYNQNKTLKKESVLKENINNSGLITFSQLVEKVKEYYSIIGDTDEEFDEITNMDELIALLNDLGFNRKDEAYEFIFDAILIK